VKHVFVETNWVVDWAAPAHHQNPAAVELLERARAGELRLHLPSPCLTEARPPIGLRFQPREAKPIRKFLRWATRAGVLPPDDVAATRRVLDKFEETVAREVEPAAISSRLTGLRREPCLEIFALDERMLERAVSLSERDLQLKPHDQSILAAILERAAQLSAENEHDLSFATLDGDLQPWVRGDVLRDLYDQAGVWVYGDFALRAPARPDAWPGGGRRG
jgi:hypothetical protein